ncbi:MAG TPA: gamma-butyrobetaine hydroxylase-like domain-containing protein [Candidatus Binataceae bacterium]|nr:gamma-butyrobetaine hydroxylase-like domain-containing protein [Candidatus Binataceae bacterium]
MKSKTPARIRGLNEVGRYAVGIQWSDGHDSIYPLENLRRGCRCNACAGGAGQALSAADLRLARFARLGEEAVFIEWSDGHETLFTTDQLRELCRCALCAGEPERPITGD